MSLTYEQALDQMLGLLRTRWEALTPALNNGSPILLQYPGDVQEPPSPAAPFGRVRIRHYANPRHTLAPKGQRRYERSGLVTVQTFGPIADSGLTIGGLSMAEKLAIIARDAYEGEGTADGLWFRNAHILELDPDKVFHQRQARVEFQYDEMR